MIPKKIVSPIVVIAGIAVISCIWLLQKITIEISTDGTGYEGGYSGKNILGRSFDGRIVGSEPQKLTIYACTLNLKVNTESEERQVAMTVKRLYGPGFAVSGQTVEGNVSLFDLVGRALPAPQKGGGR